MTQVAEDAIRLLVDFLNTLDEDTGEDELADEPAAVAWFTERGLATAGLTVADAHAVRGALRAAADERVAPAADLAVVPLLAAPDREGGLTLTSDHPLGPFVITAVRLAHEEKWQRIKLCDMHTCRYAFYDASRNRSGRWCDMRVCGNRAKTRAFRERHKSP